MPDSHSIAVRRLRILPAIGEGDAGDDQIVRIDTAIIAAMIAVGAVALPAAMASPDEADRPFMG